MTLRSPQNRRPLPARTRYAVVALFTGALVVLAVTLRFGLSTDLPTAPLPNPATTALPTPRLSVAAPAGPEAAAPTPTVVPPAPEPAAPAALPPVAVQGDAPSAPDSGVPAPATAGPAQPILPPATATIAPGPPAVTAEPASPPAYAPLLKWMRQQFGHFLDQMGAPFATLSEPQRDALFAEFLAWHRARTSAEPAKPSP